MIYFNLIFSCIVGWEQRATDDPSQRPVSEDEQEQPTQCGCELPLGSPESASPSSCVVLRHDDSEAASLDSRTSEAFSEPPKAPSAAPLKPTDEEHSGAPPIEEPTNIICNGVHGDVTPDSMAGGEVEVEAEIEVELHDDNKEIVEGIVQEILAESERLLDEKVPDTPEKEIKDTVLEVCDFQLSSLSINILICSTDLTAFICKLCLR